jgi:hypothetical protein
LRDVRTSSRLQRGVPGKSFLVIDNDRPLYNLTNQSQIHVALRPGEPAALETSFILLNVVSRKGHIHRPGSALHQDRMTEPPTAGISVSGIGCRLRALGIVPYSLISTKNGTIIIEVGLYPQNRIESNTDQEHRRKSRGIRDRDGPVASGTTACGVLHSRACHNIWNEGVLVMSGETRCVCALFHTSQGTGIDSPIVLMTDSHV